MTSLHPALRRRSVRAGVLGDGDLAEVRRLIDTDPIGNVVIAARMRALGPLSSPRFGGVIVGARHADALTGAAFSGGNLLPIGGDPQAWDALARFVVSRPRICSSIVGDSDAVAVMWPLLKQYWGPAREVRPRQPLLVLERPGPHGGDGRVRPVRLEEFERYLLAAVAMFREELGTSPLAASGGASYRARVEALIGHGRAFAIFDDAGEVIFKADIGAVSEHTCQVQGVWVRPDLRGQGIGTAALATVLRQALALAPSVSLYVNDFNTAARRMYDRLGMRQVATFTSVLF